MQSELMELGPETLEYLHQMLVLLSAPSWGLLGALLLYITTEGR